MIMKMITHAEEKHPREEFCQRDQRKVHGLNTLMSLEQVRREMQQANSISTSKGDEVRTNLPSQTANSATSTSGDETTRAPVPWSALAAAKSHLMMEKPDTYDRLTKIIYNCKLSGELRKTRLDSLGVFDSETNEVRSRTMLRVQMHQELSTTSMRLPNTMKDVKAPVTASLSNKLDRMFQKVLVSIEEPNKKALAPKATAGLRRVRTLFPDLPRSPGGNSTGFVPTPQSNAAPAPHGWQNDRTGELSHSTSSRPRLRRLSGMVSSMSRTDPMSGVSRVHSGRSTKSVGEAATSPTRGSKPTHEWRKPPLLPEAAEAQLRHLAVVTERHLAKYHHNVTQAQQQLLLSGGLDAKLLDCSPEELHAMLIKELEEVTEEVVVDAHKTVSDVTRRVHEAQRMPELVAACMEHVVVMQKELDEMTTVERKHKRRPARNATVHQLLPGTAAGSSVFPGASLSASIAELSALAASSDTGHCEELSRPPSNRSVQESVAGSIKAVPEALPAPPAPPTALSMMLMASKSYPVTLERVADFTALVESTSARLQQPQPLEKIEGPPRLVDAANAGHTVQGRLERVWSLLDVPLVRRLDMVLEYTRKERVMQFEKGLEVWEKAAALVQKRQALLSRYSMTKEGLESGTVPTVSISSFERLCCSILTANGQLKTVSRVLLEDFGAKLEFRGFPYPVEDDVLYADSSVPQFVRLMTFIQAYEGPVTIVP